MARHSLSAEQPVLGTQSHHISSAAWEKALQHPQSRGEESLADLIKRFKTVFFMFMWIGFSVKVQESCVT